MERFDAKELKVKTHLLHSFIKSWNEPLKKILPLLLEGYQSGVETGDLEFATSNLSGQRLSLKKCKKDFGKRSLAKEDRI